MIAKLQNTIKDNIMYKKIIKFVIYALLLCSILVFFVDVIWNIQNNIEFGKIQITTVINVAMAIFVSYFLTQNRLEKRLSIDKYEKLLFKICENIEKFNLNVGCDNIDSSYCHILLKNMSTRILLLKKYCNIKGVSKDIQYIESCFIKMRNIFGENFQSQPNESEWKKQIFNETENIQNKCETIEMKFHVHE